MLASGIILLVLLVINAAFVRVFFGANVANVDDRVFHAAQFVLPMVMIAIEYWIFDQLTARRRLRNQRD